MPLIPRLIAVSFGPGRSIYLFRGIYTRDWRGIKLRCSIRDS